MNKQIRKSKFTKVLACYLAMMILLQMVQPMQLYALTEGPSQPEFNSFTPIGTSDMVDLASGDFNYNIPIMDVGGYPINLAYNSGVTMDQEASWVGLGWNLNVGQINRNVRGIPDDFKGDIIETNNNLKTNVTVGVNPYLNVQVIGALDGPALSLGAGLDVQYNNYRGFIGTPSFGPSFKFSDFASVGMQLSSSVEEGVSVTPSVSLSATAKGISGSDSFGATLSPSVTYNSRQGLQSFNISSGISYMNGKMGQYTGSDKISRSGSGSISFLNNTFTPSKRLAFKNSNVRFSFSTGVDLWGVHGEISIAGYGSIQKLISKNNLQESFGYENTDQGNEWSLLDFNREKEQSTVSKSTLVLPVTNYTYDLYSIQGQGIGGMFRPFRGQVGYVFDSKVIDQSTSDSFGFEIEGGAGGHKGLNFRTSTTDTYTGNWESAGVMPFLREKTTGNLKDYEKVYYKNIGESRADRGTLFQNLGSSSPITLKIDLNKDAVNVYRQKIPQVDETNSSNQSLLTDGTSFTTNTIKRTKRELRNQVVQKITKREAQDYALQPFINYNNQTVNTTLPDGTVAQRPVVPGHHTAGYIITDENSNRHVYGETAYNKEKKEVTFNVGNPSTANISGDEGQVVYSYQDNTSNNSKGRDHYFNSVKTPAYAHTYLLTSVLSSDYEDLTGNGPTDDDLGTYTKFNYQNKGDYKWRIPYGKIKGTVKANVASYNEGLKTDNVDQKGSYIYGVKENKYLSKIETKTHVAFIDVVRRNDGYGVKDENGGGSARQNNFDTSNQTWCIKSIRLYSKPEAKRANLLDNNPKNDVLIPAIKTAHFEYSYKLCDGIDNNFNIGERGKLTLEKVYFTYGDSKMGKYTPYVFDYRANATDAVTGEKYNPSYNVKAYDIWGNYKPFVSGSASTDSPYTTPQEFPYVDQNNRARQDVYAAAWTLSAINLPSGGKIVVDYEADDYQYVQNKKAMQMFKVHGVTDQSLKDYVPTSVGDKLYTATTDAKYVVIQIPASGDSEDKIIKRYTDGLVGKPVYFNFLMNMTPNSYDYVSGYFEMEGEAQLKVMGGSNPSYLFIPMKKVNMEGKGGATPAFNPISVAGWFFGRQNLNGKVFGGGLSDPEGSVPGNVVDLGKSIVNNLGALFTIFKGANEVLKGRGCAKQFMPKKSWIRLLEPTGSKVGGGSRVKSVVLLDQWDKMMNIASTHADIARYAKQYGQKYEYDLADGTSSGVATYEPNISKENPLIVPFYHKKERLAEQTYQEKPFGESFFPSPTVTYSKITVSNITASGVSSSGKVVTHHYTSRDFPTLTDFTNLDKSKIFETNENQAIENMLKSMLGLNVNTQTDLTMSQGFVVETNDMNGKLKKQEVFNNADALISSVEYKYSTKAGDDSILNNKLPTIREDGTINELEIATHYDVVNDLRESYSYVNSSGAAVNIDYIPLGFIPIIIGWGKPERSKHTQILRTAVTTKVIHKSGILKEKIAYDLGSKVSTKNLAWDENSGQVLLTETVNEFDDNYYSFNFPAYWYNKEMGMASQNVDITGALIAPPPITGTDGTKYFLMSGVMGAEIKNYLKPGDEILMNQTNKRFWVTGYDSTNSGVSLIRQDGQKVLSLISPLEGYDNFYNLNFRVIRSGFKNQQMASMASLTLMKNPITKDAPLTGYKSNIKDSFKKTSTIDPKIINASAIEYSDFWEAQCENGLQLSTQGMINPYLYNIKGEWRPIKSYAYLTGRTTGTTINTRKTGYFVSFNPFYRLDAFNRWEVDPAFASSWTYASEVTKYNPYGVEVENKDALNRHSSAQYGYKYKFPVAIASNAQYKEMGFDGFEDYDLSNWSNPSVLKPHFGFNEFIDGDMEKVISDKKSHTGKSSIQVPPYEPVQFVRKINPCTEQE